MVRAQQDVQNGRNYEHHHEIDFRNHLPRFGVLSSFQSKNIPAGPTPKDGMDLAFAPHYKLTLITGENLRQLAHLYPLAAPIGTEEEFCC